MSEAALEARLASLERRLAEMRDLREIEQLKYRYFRACDAKDVETFRDSFAAGEIVIEYARIGSYRDRDALTKAFEEMACHEHIVEMHHAHNPCVELIDEGRARGEWALHYYMINTRDRSAVQLGGRYLDEYARVEDGWRISASTFEVGSTQMLDFADGELKLAFAGRSAPAQTDDPRRQA